MDGLLAAEQTGQGVEPWVRKIGQDLAESLSSTRLSAVGPGGRSRGDLAQRLTMVCRVEWHADPRENTNFCMIGGQTT